MSKKDLLSYQGLRLDGRRPNELRKVKCKLGVFTQPDGSAYLEQGNTKVLAAVYGPHQASKGKGSPDGVIINCQYSMATFSTGERKRRPRGDRKSQEMSLHLCQVLNATIKTEIYPRSQIDVYVEVLQLSLELLPVAYKSDSLNFDLPRIISTPITRLFFIKTSQADGGSYCACVNAATLALVDAGIPLRAYAAACTASLAWLGRNRLPEPLLDVCHVEEAAGGPSLTVAALPSKNKIALLDMSQMLQTSYMDTVLNVALKGCKDIEVVLDAAVRDYLTQSWTQGGYSNKASTAK